MRRISSQISRLQPARVPRPSRLRLALVFGPESRGLSPHRLAEWGGRAVRIPIRPEARSLNLANAATVALFEAIRQIGLGI